jgi:hypothetical protein
MIKFAAFIFLLLTSPLWVPVLLIVFGIPVAGFISFIEGIDFIKIVTGVAVCYGLVSLFEKADKVVEGDIIKPTAPHDTYGHIFTKPKQ